MDILNELGIQSYCFRGFSDNAQVAEMVRACGLSKIELWQGHGLFDHPNDFGDVIATYKNAGVDIVSMGQQTFSGNVALEWGWFDFITQAGAKTITSNFTVDCVPGNLHKAEALAELYDVRLAIHNHGGRHWLGSMDALRHILSITSNRVGLCLDTAWAIDSGEDPIAMAEAFAGRVYGVHLKDFVFNRAREPEDVIVGQGNLKLREFLRVLQSTGFNGPIVLEYEGDVDDPLPALKACVEAVREALA